MGDTLAFLSQETRLCILTYHRILEHDDPLIGAEPDIATFSWQMQVLASNFNVLPLHEAIIALRENRLPPRAVCITFDDGYRSTHDLALPILKKLTLPATVFVTSAVLDEGNMWNDRIIEAIRQLPEGLLDLQQISMGQHDIHNMRDRIALVKKINDESKYLASDGRLAVIEKLEELAGVCQNPGLMLTRDMLLNLSREGIDIGGHTISHPILTKLNEQAARREIVENKKTLEEIIGKPLNLFAYPNGKIGKDFDERHMHMAQEAGYVAAFSTEIGSATKETNLFNLPRSRPWDRTPFLFQCRLLRWLASGRRNSPTNTMKVLREKRALIIPFHFPPQSASSGIQRSLSFAKNLPEYGWKPLILSAGSMAYEQKNTSQLNQLPEDTIIKRAYALDSKRHLGIAGRYPEIIALPDRWISWLFTAVPLGWYLIRRHKPEVLWSTFPISTAHLIGLSLHRLTGLPWVADFRDPMMQVDYPKSKRQRKMYQWIEAQTIRHCSKAVFTTHSALNAYQERFPHIALNKFLVIENGYDEDGFTQAELIQRPLTDTSTHKIRLLHSGVLYTAGRDPSAFFEAIAALKSEKYLDSNNFEVILRAPGEEAHFMASINTFGLQDIIKIMPPIPYRDALAEMLAVEGLLLFQGTPFNRQIPAKIYEYFRARKPIFGLLDLTGDTAVVLNTAGFHDMATMNSTETITLALHSFIQKIRNGETHVAGDDIVAASSRKHRAYQLAEIFNDVTTNDTVKF
jgi:peptidoglycan/xylan/chitin deacetylase (PgdA/CDA1 family)